MRYFHKKGNLYFCPTVNLDKIWTLVGDDVRKAHASKTDVAPVIDVTKYVRPRPPPARPLSHSRPLERACLATGVLQGAGQGRAAEPARDREGQVLLEVGGGQDQGGRRRVCAGRLVKNFQVAYAVPWFCSC